MHLDELRVSFAQSICGIEGDILVFGQLLLDPHSFTLLLLVLADILLQNLHHLFVLLHEPLEVFGAGEDVLLVEKAVFLFLIHPRHVLQFELGHVD